MFFPFTRNAPGAGDYKLSVRVASLANLNLAAMPAAVDGVTLASGDRVLAKDQTAGAENGIYVFRGAGNAATRAADANRDAEVTAGLIVSVSEGGENEKWLFALTTPDPIDLGTTALTFERLAVAGMNVIEVRTSDPDPADLYEGRIWFRSDL